MKTLFRTFVSLSFVVCLAASAALAQSAASADLEGVVTDASGAAIPGAALTVTNSETGVGRQSVTNMAGRYRIAALPAGEYELRASKDGFASVDRKGLLLHVGQVATLDIQLPVAGGMEKITVTESAPIIETGRAAVGAVVNREEIASLPSNGRDFLSYSTTVAGVTAQQTSGQGSGLSFNGQRGRSNNISVDGADNNGQLNGNNRLTMSQEAVREFQVVTNQFAPEFGGAGGGLVNVVSRSGTNDFHGNVFLFARNEALDGTQCLRHRRREASLPPQEHRRHPGRPSRAQQDVLLRGGRIHRAPRERRGLHLRRQRARGQLDPGRSGPSPTGA